MSFVIHNNPFLIFLIVYISTICFCRLSTIYFAKTC
nr:MAG TPA: hypothetical protein [Caudoviricetes sp.]